MSRPPGWKLGFVPSDDRTETGENEMIMTMNVYDAGYDCGAIRRYMRDGLPPWKGKPSPVHSGGHSKHNIVSRREAKRKRGN